MPMTPLDLTGRQFGLLTAIRPVGSNANKNILWLMQCQCGKQITRVGSNLQNPHRPYPKSCGCNRQEVIRSANGTHMQTNTPLYYRWNNIRFRCNNPNDKDWANYGGRGIRICDEWQNSFETFARDMGPSYKPGLQLDRKDNSGPYSKENCRWATPKEQSNNTRVNVWLETPKGRMTIAQAAEAFNMKTVTLARRIRVKDPDPFRPVKKYQYSTS